MRGQFGCKSRFGGGPNLCVTRVWGVMRHERFDCSTQRSRITIEVSAGRTSFRYLGQHCDLDVRQLVTHFGRGWQHTNEEKQKGCIKYKNAQMLSLMFVPQSQTVVVRQSVRGEPDSERMRGKNRTHKSKLTHTQIRTAMDPAISSYFRKYICRYGWSARRNARDSVKS